MDERVDFSSVSQVDVVDVSSGEIRTGPSMRHARYAHAAAASPTSLFVFGGNVDTGTKKSCEIFNPRMRQ